MKPEVSSTPLVSLSLRRPIAMMMVLLSMMVLGGIALSRIPLELIPSGFSPPFLQISASYPDATAKDVEERITRPLEQAVSTTPGVDRIHSSSSSGSASVTMLFKNDVDMNIAYRQVRDRVARVRPELPTEVDSVEVRKESADNLPVAFYGVNWDPELSDPHTVIEQHLVRPLRRIDGVGLVNAMGRQDPEIRIEVDRGRAEAMGVDMVALVRTLASSNFTMATGEMEESDGRYLLRSVASWENVEEIEELVINPRGLRLKEVADVVFELPKVERHDRYRGRPSMVLSVIKESQANTVDVSEKIKAVVAEAEQGGQLAGMRIESIFIQGDTIRYSLDQVFDSGRQGGILALIVLIFFLRRVRLTIMISLAIPLSLFLSLPVMYFTGQTINLVSLVGLMICIGLVVDNSVVVAENIGRYRKRGLGPYAAALHGSSEVGLAITLATMTTIVVFLPASLLSEGPTQFFMVRMVTPVCVSLLASLFVALVLIPLSSATLLRERKPARPHRDAAWRVWVDRIDGGAKRVLGWAYDQTMGRVASGYIWLLRVVLRRRIDVVIVSLLAMGSMVVPVMNVSCETSQSFGGRNIKIHYSMPSDTTLEEANTFFKQIEAQVEEYPADLPLDGAYVGFDANKGFVQLFFKPPVPGEPPFEETAKRLADEMPVRPGWRKYSELGESDGARDESFRVIIFGDEHERVQDAREVLEQQLLTIDGVIGLKTEGDGDTRRRDELALSVEREMSERFDVPATAVANTVAYAIRGTPLPRYHTDEREVDVRVRYREDDRRDVDQLLGYRVQSTNGQTVPIGVLAEKTIEKGEARLTRTNKRVGAVIRLELDKEQRMEAARRVIDYLRQYELPEGLSFNADHSSNELEDMQRDLTGALILGSIFIFLLMGFLFESLILPLSVLPSIPLSFVGVWWFLFVTGESIDALAGIGIVLLLGVVVNNAIVLIDFISKARDAGLDRTQAIVRAGQLRFRPIMMTALTTIGGMLPLAFAENTGEGIAYGPFGKALVGGMTTATILTLVVVPVTYTYLDDLRLSAGVWWRRLRRLTGR